MKALYDDKILETTWQEIEYEMKHSGQIKPEAGFTTRWHARLSAKRKHEQRRQAAIFIAVNLIASTVLLILIVAAQFRLNGQIGDPLSGIVQMFSKMIVYIDMAQGILVSLLKTLPNLIPHSWRINILVMFIMLVMYWASTLRSVYGKSGVTR